MANDIFYTLVNNNQQYAQGKALHNASYPGPQPIKPAKRTAVIACMDARMDVEDILGLQTGDAHIIRNAGGIVTDDVIRCLVISHHLLDTQDVMVIHHTRCGMLSFTDELLRMGLEGDTKAVEILKSATGRDFTPCGCASHSPSGFHAFRGELEPLDAPVTEKQIERLEMDVRKSMSMILNHPWLPTEGKDKINVRGFIYDVDTGKLQEVSYPGTMGGF
ncbi:carbonic anhydrase [Ferrovum sp. PN-J185]|uniref:beta-class carbonic anhydrase n=1 Tax=Ferrovum sp. PN-J185 TaxID=1356306 RepID=UPI001E2E53A5|nr:carbonic anhydrase [Ferrovum sp. PN-J185]MCC6068616.1 carbonic anhydrase [Ferrovum sp. PN-J185]